jgi:hypothetical protein
MDHAMEQAMDHADDMESHDDMGWLCSWGGLPLLAWERLDLHESDRAVVDFVDYWLWKEAFHVHLSDKYLRTHPCTEDGMRHLFFHMQVQELRARSDRARERGLCFTLPP